MIRLRTSGPAGLKPVLNRLRKNPASRWAIFLAFHLGALGLGPWHGIAATTYYVDPASGSMSNPGTSEQPWSTLEAVGTAAKVFAAGDVLVLRTGHHGSPTLRGQNSGEVMVRAEPGARATLKSLIVRAARKWRFQGLEISPETAPEFSRVTLVSLMADASETVLENCLLYTVRDSSAWTAADWDTKACSGISVAGPGNVIRSNTLLNVNFGISVSGVSNRVERNLVENFSGDGLRGLGDYGVFEYNVVKNCYDVNANHDDGFQSWSVGPGGVGTGVVRGMVLRGNRILNYENPNQPYRGTLQGIGCFDGFYEDWIIENNEILTDHWHGITLMGARNCRISNNTVVDLNTASPGPPWIRISKHKDGTPSTGNVIRNNWSTDFSVDAGAALRDHNIESQAYAQFFENYPARDLRLRPGCPAVDLGSNEQAPALDITGRPRPLDGNNDKTNTCDIGAHELVHPLADSDGDRMSDADELKAGTSPIDSKNILLLNATVQPNGDLRLSWPSVPGRNYALLSAGNLDGAGWTQPGGGTWRAGTGAELFETRIPGSASEFFRVVVTAE